MEYRIKKHSYRVEETGEIKSYFTIEELHTGVTFWRKRRWQEWVSLRIILYRFEGTNYYREIKYDTKKEACAHLKWLKEKVPEDEIVTC